MLKFLARALPPQEPFAPGHRACAGCGATIALRQICKALGENVIIAHATGCLEIVSSPYPFTSWRIPWIHVAFENAAAVASGIKSGLKAIAKKSGISNDVKVVAIAGDGGTSDIGLQALSGALERGHDFLYICYDNEAYMNTGIQRSSATPFGACTTTSPSGKVSIGQRTFKKNLPAIVAAHNIKYVATANPSYPLDLMEKVRKAIQLQGPKYIHILTPCPTGWGFASDLTIEVGRLAVETGFFNLFEIEDGKFKFSIKIPKLRKVEDYLKIQRRFAHLKAKEFELIQKRIEEEKRYLEQWERQG
jgi:pyruvate ferredoxin oxidoreductase beta subunit